MIEYKVDQFVAQGDRVVMLGRLRVAPQEDRQGGRDTPKADSWRFANGKAVEFYEYFDTAQVHAAVGCAVAKRERVMTDLNNRPGGPNLIVTAKTAHKVHFLDAATLTMQATIDMPGSTHELALSAGRPHRLRHGLWRRRFAKRVNPDRRIVVIDLPSKSLTRVIDLGAVYAPHGVMMDEQGTLWSSGELGNAVLAIDPASDKVRRSTSATPPTGWRSAMPPARCSCR